MAEDVWGQTDGELGETLPPDPDDLVGFSPPTLFVHFRFFLSFFFVFFFNNIAFFIFF